jgi:hypothetical protein
MIRPVRLQLSRRKGFNLQALSLATNGLPAVKVTRPSILGNPFSVLPKHEPGKAFGNSMIAGEFAFGTIAVPTAEDAVECFRKMVKAEGNRAQAIRDRLPALRGKNIACFCALGAPCHGDIYLELANAPICEEAQ